MRVVADDRAAMCCPRPADSPCVRTRLAFGQKADVTDDIISAWPTNRVRGAPGGTASGDPGAGRVSNFANAAGPILARSTA